MQPLDWTILFLYFAGLVALAFFLARKQKTTEDYFLAGRAMGSWPIALSIMATQVSTVSLIGAPAFVALHPHGGLKWLQYELAVPLAMIGIALWLLPTFYRLRIVSLYEFIDRRFGSRAQLLLSLVFLISRGLSSGVILYASSVVLAVTLKQPVGEMIAVVGIVTVLYTTVGGIKADIYSDIAQLVILVLGALVALFCAMQRLDDPNQLWAIVDPARLRPLEFSSHGLGDGQTFAFWPMLMGGFFLYLSYYGCDQSQTQRLLTAPKPAVSVWALCWNGLLRFPLVLLYSFLGVVLVAFLAAHPEFRASIPAEHPDFLVPMFMVRYLPSGAIGIVLAGLFAASMSSLDSAYNSMSAVTMKNFVEPIRARRRLKMPASFATRVASDEKTALRESRIWTAAWGLLSTWFGYVMSGAGRGVIELINMVGSAFYGPILAMFLLGIFSKRVDQRGAVIGLVSGVGVNVLLWKFAPNVSWLWWNPIGCAVTTAISWGASFAFPAGTVHGFFAAAPSVEENQTDRMTVRRCTIILLLAFFLMLSVLWVIPLWSSR